MWGQPTGPGRLRGRSLLVMIVGSDGRVRASTSRPSLEADPRQHAAFDGLDHVGDPAVSNRVFQSRVRAAATRGRRQFRLCSRDTRALFGEVQRPFFGRAASAARWVAMSRSMSANTFLNSGAPLTDREPVRDRGSSASPRAIRPARLSAVLRVLLPARRATHGSPHRRSRSPGPSAEPCGKRPRCDPSACARVRFPRCAAGPRPGPAPRKHFHR